ncbi:MAG: hypothetical protein A2V65_02075 [Deltaproteobacteria bacterium RBG_13_49_15]|nr:MAG: hypothetical protein A2V65_02075 [Deltaproteobacteria bacterium RBG_13_49_15]
MSFKENLLKKIEIDRLAAKVMDSIGSPGSDRKTDRETMRLLIQMGPHDVRKERDLELYILGPDDAGREILVLDNELAIYSTTAEDVALRKSPTLKEMLSIRNAVKILNDKDVKICKKEDSVRRIRENLIKGIDLSFSVSDLEEIENDGNASLERMYSEGVIQSLTLFAELLGYLPAPKPLAISQCHVIGGPVRKASGEQGLDPVVIYHIIHNALMLIEGPIGIFDKEKIEEMHQIASGRKKRPKEGAAVFSILKEAVILKKPGQPGG